MEHWFTADLHLLHAKVIELQPRPYASVEEMTEHTIAMWNSVVKAGDIVYVLGDFAVAKAVDKPIVDGVFKRLNGEKMLIRGNHDERNLFIEKFRWRWVGDIKRVEIGGKNIVLCHYPMQVWAGSMEGSWHLYGHVHGKLPEHWTCLKMDVGVDVPFCGDFLRRPFSFGEIKDVMSKRALVAPDRRRVYYEEDFEGVVSK